MPKYGLVHLLDLPQERLEIIELLLGEDSPVTGQRVGDLELPEGSLLISVLREGTGFVPGPDTVLEPGDEVLAVLDPGLEEELKAYFGPDGGRRSDRGGRMTRPQGRLPADRRRHGVRPLRRGAAQARGRGVDPAGGA